MGFWTVFGAAAQAVLLTLILAAVGAAMERSGQLGKTKRAALSAMTYNVLLPALLFYNVASSISMEALGTLWLMPFYACLYMAVGAAIGAAAGRLVATPRDDFGPKHITICSMLGNHGYIPLVIAPAVIGQRSLHAPGTADVAEETAKAISCVSIFIIIINLCTFSVAPKLMKMAAAEKLAADAAAAAATALPSPAEGSSPSNSSSGWDTEAPSSPAPAASAMSPIADTVALVPAAASVGSDAPPQQPPAPALVASQARALFAALATPPVIGSFTGMVVGLIPPFKRLLFGTPATASALLASAEGIALSAACTLASTLQGSNATVASWQAMNATAAASWVASMQPSCEQLAAEAALQASSSADAPLGPTVTAAARSLSQAVTPVITIMLGSTIAERPLAGTDAAGGRPPIASWKQYAAQAIAASGVRWQALAATVFLRLICAPLVGMTLVWTGLKMGIVPPDRTLLFVLLLEASTPPAMNLQLICEVAGVGQKAMSSVICVTYIASIVTTTMWITAYLMALQNV